MIIPFLFGAIMMGCLGISLFFFRFWQKTSDRLFLWFSIAFGLLAAERILGILVSSQENNVSLYTLRLVAFLLILAAVVDKNVNRP